MNLSFPFCRLGNGLADKWWKRILLLCRLANGLADKRWKHSLPLCRLGNGLADQRRIIPSLSRLKNALADKRLIPPFCLQTWFIWSMPSCPTSKCFSWQEMKLSFPFIRLGNGSADKRWISPSLSADREMIRYEPLPLYLSENWEMV